ncbi:hypothetical protein INT45_008838 [Circinella minor]|uniref:Alpha/beta hydrolase fold-3 domain-containing protein n=1 Tax=Circinella minor TaxID=1195481 RepID=A0A8H7VM50_9FUNG|nr:hypothetical protein INT45_008838 [Circinella minor]
MPHPPPVKLHPLFEQFIKYCPDLGINHLTPQQAREKLTAPPQSEELQVLFKLVIECEKVTKNGIKLTITRPAHIDDKELLPVILFFHGGGFIVGDVNSHQWLRTILTIRCNAAVVFVNYTLSPEAKYPTALEESYDALTWVLDTDSSIHHLDSTKIAVAGDSAGGTLSAALSIIEKQRRGDKQPRIKAQVLYYPSVDSQCNSSSVNQFADGYMLSKANLKYFWSHYLNDEKDGLATTAAPLHASVEELQGIAPALIVTAEADVLRDEGEAYVRRLVEAGVPVTGIRAIGTIHGFMGIATSGPTVDSILDQTVSFLNRQWGI